MMGSFFSRQGGRVEELHEDSSFSYIYPPNSGQYKRKNLLAHAKSSILFNHTSKL